MEKLSFEQIMEILEEELERVNDFAYGDFDSEELGLGKSEEVIQQGGADQGSEWYVVHYFKDHDVYIRCDGYYSSYNGTDFDDGWDCCSQVVPTQKTITVYE